MIQFQEINVRTFLKDYWQKKPLVLRNAIPNFINPLTPDELAGLALEEDVESRIVWETPQEALRWHLKRGPFVEQDFTKLPQTHWTLLVQGVDRLIPQVHELLQHFNFIPRWRIDDVMISYASLAGSVGPHYDNYDVFLYQAQGRREWSLTSQHCIPENYLKDLELRIMREFPVEEQFILEEGDMLYLPPHIGHYGIAASEECMTYSFGYRSYQGQELIESLSDFLSEQAVFKDLYSDPDWSALTNSAEINKGAWGNAQKLLRGLLDKEDLMRSWFGSFATRLDQQAEQLLPMPLEEDEDLGLEHFIQQLHVAPSLDKDSSCRFAYIGSQDQRDVQLFINGCEWDIAGVSEQLVIMVANQDSITLEDLLVFLNTPENLSFLYELWKLQWLYFGGA